MIEKRTEASESPLAHEIQNTVARLLTKENIQVHRSFKYKTAFFELKSRTIGLPILAEGTPSSVYDLFIAHEAGHALWSQEEDYEAMMEQFPGWKDLINILEDIRIEKKILKTYPGLIRDFRAGYAHLFTNKFFGECTSTPETIDQMHFLDRLNLLAKVGKAHANPYFTDEEQAIVDEAMAIDTIEDLIVVAEKIIASIPKATPTIEPNDGMLLPSTDPLGEADEYEEADEDEEVPEEDAEGEASPEDEGDSTEDDTSTDNTGTSDSKEDDTKEEDETDDKESEAEAAEVEDSELESENPDKDNAECDVPPGDIDPNAEFKSETQENLDQSIADEAGEWEDSAFSKQVQFLPFSKEQLGRSIIPFKRIFEIRDDDALYITNKNKRGSYFDEELRDFNKETKKTVAHLRNEFERKKSAYRTIRATEAKRGTINVNALHKYKYSEDIFSAITNLADAKSHGMIFLIDFSGSMDFSIAATIRRSLVLAQFCKACGIPYRMYTFTQPPSTKRDNIGIDQTLLNNRFDLSGTWLVEVLSSEMSAAEYKRGSDDLFYNLTLGYPRRLSGQEAMGGTPLLQALMLMHTVIPDFMEKTKIQVPNLIVLSDGDGSIPKFSDHGEGFEATTQQWVGFGKFHKRRMKIDLTAAKGQWGFANAKQRHDIFLLALLENIKEEFRANTLCFFIASHERNLQRNIEDKCQRLQAGNRRVVLPEDRQLKRTIKKDGIMHFENLCGFDKYIFMISRSTNSGVNFEDVQCQPENVKDIAKKFQAFTGNRIKARIFAKEFIETVCSNF